MRQKFFIINTESFSRGKIPPEMIDFRKKHGKTLTMLDESSYIKTNNPCSEKKKSMRTQTIKKLSDWGENCILTGTFMSKSPLNIYDQIEFLHKGFFPESMFEFAEKYTVRMTFLTPTFIKIRITVPKKVWENLHKRFKRAFARGGSVALKAEFARAYEYYGINFNDLNLIFIEEDYKPFKNLKALQARIADFCMIVRKEDVLDLPPKVYQKRVVQLSSEQKELYNSFVKMNMIDTCTVTNPLVLYSRLQDIVNGYKPVESEIIKNDKKVKITTPEPLKTSPKLNELEEVLEELDTDTYQAIIWCNRTRMLVDALARVESMGISVARYDGKISEAEKGQALEDFESGKARVICINQMSGSFGLDCLKKSAYAIYISNDNSTEKRVQSEDRIHRGKYDGYSRTIIDIVAEGTVDEKVSDNLKLGVELVTSGNTDAEVYKFRSS